MATVVVALGSNIGRRKQHLSDAKQFLNDLSQEEVRASSIYITEPVGPPIDDFYNAVVVINTSLNPKVLIKKFKGFEQLHGRSSKHPKWGNRTIDLDIISYNDLVIQTDNLIIPHPEYHKRLFVLMPLEELFPQWIDPKTRTPVAQLISEAPALRYKKTTLRW
ncbi:MAG TPA: 2-amino-4-hydroxy-6-hydroxymethyldihydropteridine diphosphokinase [Balneolaceae bacterium]